MLVPYGVGLLLSLGAECLLVPRPVPPWRRPGAALAVHLGLWTLAFALEMMLFRRPYFAMANVLAIQMVIVLVSYAKYQALREPFIFQDFEYFTDAIRHPRLYLPFFGAWRAVGALAAYGAALWAGLALEGTLPGPSATLPAFFVGMAALAVAGYALACLAAGRLRVTFQAEDDLRRLGLAGALWAYGRAEGASTESLRAAAPFARAQAPEGREGEPLPDLVVIQSESFFDVRRAYGQVRPEVLRHFDQLVQEAARHGQLRVGAWGANTVRTEFGFLSGLRPEALGVHAYNPYRKLGRQGFPTIVSHLKALGYRTVCLHPYHRSFYRRDAVLPALGFDAFIGLEAFADAPREGAYVSDAAVAEHLIRLLRESGDQPLYVHVITMENHGPLHWEPVGDGDIATFLRAPIPAASRDLVAYARHLRNADEMIASVRQALSAPRRRPAGLCLFGDHVPIMPAVYAGLGEVSGATDYVIWRSDRKVPAPGASLLNVAELASTYLETMNIPIGHVPAD
ncbi:LTA synthase family protein [Bordetella genomosp. 13]|uniref:LTA synthase family protein n=1 Tax=Bordetella genomosp. 13 TaxID=463040 RepID=UPI00119DB155|nr:LTA synthase family protein [Bordetella genomosp. 13]